MSDEKTDDIVVETEEKAPEVEVKDDKPAELSTEDALAELQRKLEAAEAALKTCEEIDKLESDADRVMRSAMSKLFREEEDVRELIKLKAVYELLETITDKCEDVANLIEGIVLENS